MCTLIVFGNVFGGHRGVILGLDPGVLMGESRLLISPALIKVATAFEPREASAGGVVHFRWQTSQLTAHLQSCVLV